MADKQRALGMVVPHTHWDREWRYPIWKHRMLLVEFMDRLLDVLDRDPAYRNFLLDGQCVPIEDYLEIRPENDQRVRRAVSDGRLSIGPWYTLPDLYPLDGECLVRNLLRGVRLADRYGGSMRIGYNSFGWGQIAQFPQIYAGFGFEMIFAAKNVAHDRAPRCEFWWRSPDGTRVLTSRMGRLKRANAFFNVMIPLRYGMAVNDAHYFYDPTLPWAVIHNAATDRADDDHFRIDTDQQYHRDRIAPGFRAAWEDVKDTAAPGVRILLNGCDFSDELAELSRVIADANDQLEEIEIVHASLDEYAAKLREKLNLEALGTVDGEMRDGPSCACSGNALTTRMYLKIANKAAQNRLIREAEPMRSALALAGVEYPAARLDSAWKHLLLSHPHDAINGVTQDKTADDVLNRINQAIEIGQVLVEDGIGAIASRVDCSGFDERDVCLLAYNPLPRPVRAVRKVSVDLPRDQNIWAWRLLDADGGCYDVQQVARREGKTPVHDPFSRPFPYEHDKHEAWVDLGELPAGGYKAFKIDRTGDFRRDVDWWPTQRTSRGDEISTGPDRLENEHLHVQFHADGTLTLTDKQTGRVFESLHWFEDAGDVGDYWAYYPPYHDQVHTSRGGPARIWREDNGPLAATIGVEITMHLPMRADRAHSKFQGHDRRVEQTAPFVIRSRFTLTRGSRKLDVRTVIDNHIEDHRLRVMLPTGLDVTHSDASGHFTVDRRPVDPRREPDGTFWPEMQTLPMQHFVDLSDGAHGLGVVHSGMIEFEALGTTATTLAITLFRAVRNRICTEWRATGAMPNQQGGQCLREMTFEYAICPHAGNWADAGLYDQAEQLNAPPIVYQMSSRGTGDWPVQQSWLRVEPANLVVSAFKKAEDRDSYILRLFNPTPGPGNLSGRITLPTGITRAWRTNLNEVREDDIAITDGAVVLDVEPNRIVTIELSV
jgi:mannosylglycerate hydrolase